MHIDCPYCLIDPTTYFERPKTKRFGFFRRRSDSRIIQRFRCTKCLRSFSRATRHPAYRQNKRQMNKPLRQLFCSGVSQRRAARILNLSRTTIVRKLLYLAKRSEHHFVEANKLKNKAVAIEFDDMETFEHTKCKPLSITLAVEMSSRRILGFEVSQMPAKGLLVHIARKKYGPRKDHRRQGRAKLFKRIQQFVASDALIKSDENPHYPQDVRKWFPKANYQRFKGQRGSIVGQGELKKIRFDPLFSLNHTCAMFRANVNRLFRRTWCTTKKPDRLVAHLVLYAHYHNQNLKVKAG
jgi:transposase-like protein